MTDSRLKENSTQVMFNMHNDVMPVYKFIQYGDYYSKTLGSLWNYCRYEPFLSDASDSVGFTSVDFSDPFNFKQKITGKAGDDGTKDIEVMVSLKNLTKF